jgi:hypothetical protein
MWRNQLFGLMGFALALNVGAQTRQPPPQLRPELSSATFLGLSSARCAAYTKARQELPDSKNPYLQFVLGYVQGVANAKRTVISDGFDNSIRDWVDAYCQKKPNDYLFWAPQRFLRSTNPQLDPLIDD